MPSPQRNSLVNAQPTSALLSIVLPAFNEEQVLRSTYERLTAQGPVFDRWGLDWELIFVDDGSADRTGEILDELAAGDAHVSPSISRATSDIRPPSPPD